LLARVASPLYVPADEDEFTMDGATAAPFVLNVSVLPAVAESVKPPEAWASNVREFNAYAPARLLFEENAPLPKLYVNSSVSLIDPPATGRRFQFDATLQFCGVVDVLFAHTY
jgi:hypothetical protein